MLKGAVNFQCACDMPDQSQTVSVPGVNTGTKNRDAVDLTLLTGVLETWLLSVHVHAGPMHRYGQAGLVQLVELLL